MGLTSSRTFSTTPHYDTTPLAYLRILRQERERYLRAARIVQSVLSVLTIPLTSAVCSQAGSRAVYPAETRGQPPDPQAKHGPGGQGVDQHCALKKTRLWGLE